MAENIIHFAPKIFLAMMDLQVSCRSGADQKRRGWLLTAPMYYQTKEKIASNWQMRVEDAFVCGWTHLQM